MSAIINKDTKLSIGIVIIFFGGLGWWQTQLTDMKATLRDVVTIEDAHNFRSEFQKLNKDIKLPEVQEVIRQRR